MRGLMQQPERLRFGTNPHSSHLAFCMERFRAAAEAKKEVEELGLTAYKNFRSYLNREKHPFPVYIYDPVFFGTLMSSVAQTVDAMHSSPPIFDYQTDAKNGGDDESTRALQDESDDHVERMRPWLPTVKGVIGQSLVGTQYWDIWWDYQEKVCARREESTVQREFLDAWNQPQTVEIPSSERVLYTEPLYDGPRFAPRHITRAYADTEEEDLQRGAFYARRDEVSAEDCRLCVKLEDWDKENVERAIQDTGSMSIQEGLGSIRTTSEWLHSIGLNTLGVYNQIVGRKRLEVIRFYHRRNGQVLKTVILNRAVIAYFGPSEFDHGLYPAVKSTNYQLQNEHFGISDWEIVRWLIQGIQTLRNAAGSEALLGTMPVYQKLRDSQIDGCRWEPNAFWEVDSHESIKLVDRDKSGAALGNNEAEVLRASMDAALGTGGETGRGNVDREATATAVNQALNAAGQRGKFRANSSDEQIVVPTAHQWGKLTQWGSKNPLVWQARVIELPTAAAAINKELTQKRLMQLHTVAQGNIVYKSEEGIRMMAESIAMPKEAERLLRTPEEVQQMMAAQQMQGMAGMAPGAPPAGGMPLSGPEPFAAGDPTMQGAADLRDAMAA